MNLILEKRRAGSDDMKRYINRILFVFSLVAMCFLLVFVYIRVAQNTARCNGTSNSAMDARALYLNYASIILQTDMRYGSTNAYSAKSLSQSQFNVLGVDFEKTVNGVNISIHSTQNGWIISSYGIYEDSIYIDNANISADQLNPVSYSFELEALLSVLEYEYRERYGILEDYRSLRKLSPTNSMSVYCFKTDSMQDVDDYSKKLDLGNNKSISEFVVAYRKY